MISFDNSPVVYWFIGYLIAGIAFVMGLRKNLPIELYLTIGAVLMVFMRLPVIVFNQELNPDESQMLSHGITLFQDPIYWKSVDGTTIGPLDNYLLVVPKLLGFQIDYTSGRIMGILCTVSAWVLLFLTLKNWFGTTVARQVSLLPLLLLSFTQEIDFTHYSSEQLPVMLLTCSLWLFSRIDFKKISSAYLLYALGFVAGAVPFGKLQGVPLAIVIVLMTFWYCIKIYLEKNSHRQLLALVAGGLTVPLIFLLFTLRFNIFNDFIDFYLLSNAIYADGGDMLDIPSKLVKIVRLSPDFQVFTVAMIIPMIIGLYEILRLKVRPGQHVSASMTILLLVLCSVYAVTKSGNDFVHYLNFCILPWTLLAAYGWTKFERLRMVFPALMLSWFAVGDSFSFLNERKLNNFDSTAGRTALSESPVVKEINKRSLKGDYLTVWGWQCAYYVQTQLAQGTAENHSERCIFLHKMRETYRMRYISDVRRTTPAFIVDAVGKNSHWTQDKKTQGIQSFPELSAFVSQHYTLLKEIDDTKLYVRNDRLR